MAHDSPIRIEYSAALKDQISGLERDETVELLNQTFVDNPITSVVVKVAVEDDDRFERLSIVSGIALSEVPASSKAIIRNVADAIADEEAGSDVPLKYSRPFTTIGHSILALEHPYYTKVAATVISPVLLGEGWGINSVLNNFRFNHEADDSIAANHLIDQHILALRALVGVLASYRIGEAASSTKLRIQFPERVESHPEEKGDYLSSFDSFVGIDNVISEITDMMSIADTPDEELKRYGIERIQAILLHGPSGVGKTALAHSIAKGLSAELNIVDFSEMQNMYVGEWAANIDNVFNTAFASSGRVVIFFDEIESILATGNPHSTQNITGVMKRKLEQLKQYPHVFFVGATNHIDAIDPDIRAPKRIPLVIPISKPVPDQRENLFKSLLVGETPQLTSYEDIEKVWGVMDKLQASIDFKSLSDKTVDLSAGEIKELIARVHRQNFLEARRSDTEPKMPTQAQLEEAIKWANQRRN